MTQTTQQLSERLNQVAMCIGQLRREHPVPTSGAPAHAVDHQLEVCELLDRLEAALSQDESEHAYPVLVPGAPPRVGTGAIPDKDLRKALIAFSWRPECRGVPVQQSVNRLCRHLAYLIKPPTDLLPTGKLRPAGLPLTDPHVDTWTRWTTPIPRTTEES